MPQFAFTNRLMEKALRRAFLDGVMEIYDSTNQPRIYSVTLEGNLSLLINKSEKYYIKIQETAERAMQADPNLMPKLPNLTAQKVIGSIGSTSTIPSVDKDDQPNDSLGYMLKSSLGGAKRMVVNVKTENSTDTTTSISDIPTTRTPMITFPQKILQRILPKPTFSIAASPKLVIAQTVKPKSILPKTSAPLQSKASDSSEFSLAKVKKEPVEADDEPIQPVEDTTLMKIKSEPMEDGSPESQSQATVLQPEWIEEVTNETGIKREREDTGEEDEQRPKKMNSTEIVRNKIKATLKNPIMAISLPKETFYFHKNIVECPLCKEPISNQSFLLLHLDRHRKDFTDVCDVCREGGQPLDVLLFHMTNFHTPGAARESDISKAKPPNLHLATTSGSRIDPAKMVQLMLERENAKCTSGLNKEDSRSKKENDESDGEFQIEYVCDMCGDSFTSSKELNLHHKSAHGNNSGNFQCTSCDVKFENLYQFQDHMLDHHKEEEKCTCQMCGKQFDKWKDLKEHLMTAHRKFFSCPHCKMSFSDQQSLRDHVITHGKENPDFFECDMCDQTFVSSKTYNAHRRSHIDVKPYVCHICQSAFFKRGDMAKHMRTIHEPTKLYMCKICGRTGTRADNMRVHVRTHKKEISREQIDALLQKVDQ